MTEASKPKAVQKKFKVTPQQYNEFIEQIDLKWVYLESCTAKRHYMPDLQKELGYEDKEGRRSFDPTDGGFLVHYQYQVKLQEKDAKEPFADIKCVYTVEYSSEQPMTKDLFEVFQDLNLPLNTWPYVREFVHAVTNRMGIPALVLRTLKR